MPSDEPECIFKMGVEGGGVDFYRQWTANGAWRFTFSGSSMGIDIADDWETWSSTDTKTPGVYMTFDDAISDFSSDGDWVHWSPVEVHPDYKEYVWLLREKTISSLEERQVKRARRGDSRWARVCGQRTPRRPPNNDRRSQIVVRPGGTLDQILGASIAVIEHLQKSPMSAEEARKFEATMIRVLEKRKSEHLERAVKPLIEGSSDDSTQT